MQTRFRLVGLNEKVLAYGTGLCGIKSIMINRKDWRKRIDAVDCWAIDCVVGLMGVIGYDDESAG